MTARSGRYQLRSSQRANNDEFHDYETPGMEGEENAQLSQSDMFTLRDSQMENFMNGSFGSHFINLNPLTENLFEFNEHPKEDMDPSLCRVNYVASQEKNNSLQLQYPPEQQDLFIPSNDGFLQGPGQFLDEDPGGFVYSQGRNEEDYKLTVHLMPQLKSSNRDYLTLRNLLFVKFMAPIPFQFSMVDAANNRSIPIPNEMSIRMSLRFACPVSDEKKRVNRCHVHMDKDANGLNKRFPFKVNHKDAVYDDTKLRVTFPASVNITTTFYCFSSCAGGIDRQAVYLLFELISADGVVYQSVPLPVKVCANPTRDAPKEEAKRRKEEEKAARGRGNSEASGEVVEKRGRKRKTEERLEMETDMKRMDSTSPMQSLHTPSPGWNTTMSAPRVSSRRDSKMELHSASSEGVLFESPECSRKTSHEEDEDKVYEIKIQGRKKYEAVMNLVQMLETNERYKFRNDSDNPFENLTQLTGGESIDTWLSQMRLNERPYVDGFTAMGIYTLDDIESVYSPTLFHLSIGIPREAAIRLNRVYLNWLNVNGTLN